MRRTADVSVQAHGLEVLATIGCKGHPYSAVIPCSWLDLSRLLVAWVFFSSSSALWWPAYGDGSSEMVVTDW